MKNFKFFDLDNSGGVDRDEFSKAIEKAGIQILNKQVKKQKLLESFFKFIDTKELEDLFNAYDSNNDGHIDYHEFVSNLFGVEIAR